MTTATLLFCHEYKYSQSDQIDKVKLTQINFSSIRGYYNYFVCVSHFDMPATNAPLDGTTVHK